MNVTEVIDDFGNRCRTHSKLANSTSPPMNQEMVSDRGKTLSASGSRSAKDMKTMTPAAKASECPTRAAGLEGNKGESMTTITPPRKVPRDANTDKAKGTRATGIDRTETCPTSSHGKVAQLQPQVKDKAYRFTGLKEKPLEVFLWVVG
jgi:hypothetical protein